MAYRGGEACRKKSWAPLSLVERNTVTVRIDAWLCLPLCYHCGGERRLPTDSVGSGRNLRSRCEVRAAGYRGERRRRSATMGLECQEIAGEYRRAVANVGRGVGAGTSSKWVPSERTALIGTAASLGRFPDVGRVSLLRRLA